MKIAGSGHLGEQRGAGGRPGHLVRYLRQSGISEPIVVLSQAKADDWDWFARYSAFFDRHIRQGDSLDLCACRPRNRSGDGSTSCRENRNTSARSSWQTLGRVEVIPSLRRSPR